MIVTRIISWLRKYEVASILRTYLASALHLPHAIRGGTGSQILTLPITGSRDQVVSLIAITRRIGTLTRVGVSSYLIGDSRRSTVAINGAIILVFGTGGAITIRVGGIVAITSFFGSGLTSVFARVSGIAIIVLILFR